MMKINMLFLMVLINFAIGNKMYGMDKVVVSVGTFFINSFFGANFRKAGGVVGMIFGEPDNSVQDEKENKVLMLKAYSLAALRLLQDLKTIYPEHKNYLHDAEFLIRIPAFFHEAKNISLFLTNMMDGKGDFKRLLKTLYYISCTCAIHTIQSATTIGLYLILR